MSISKMPGKVSHQDSFKRRRWLRVVIALVGGLAVVLALLTYLAFRPPSWYQPQPPPVSEGEKQQIRNLLTDAEQAFTHSLLAGKPFTYRIYDEYVNQWISMRQEIYPRVDDAMPVQVQDPFVRFLPDQVLIGAKGQVASVRSVVSFMIRVVFESDRIHLQLEDVSCGSLPVPSIPDHWQSQAQLTLGFGDAWPGSPPMRGDLESGLLIDAEGVWQNGGTRYRVTDIRALDGVLELDVSPLPR